jgi:hypothetical protein
LLGFFPRLKESSSASSTRQKAPELAAAVDAVKRTQATLFSPGPTTSPTDFNSPMHDLEAKVFGRLPDQTWFYPGHGKDGTLGTERPAIAAWRARGWFSGHVWAGSKG